MSALKPSVDGLETREKFQSRTIASLQNKVEYYKSFLSFDDNFDGGDTLETSQATDADPSNASYSGPKSPGIHNRLPRLVLRLGSLPPINSCVRNLKHFWDTI